MNQMAQQVYKDCKERMGGDIKALLQTYTHLYGVHAAAQVVAGLLEDYSDSAMDDETGERWLKARAAVLEVGELFNEERFTGVKEGE